jgi:hypothetical protein
LVIFVLELHVFMQTAVRPWVQYYHHDHLSDLDHPLTKAQKIFQLIAVDLCLFSFSSDDVPIAPSHVHRNSGNFRSATNRCHIRSSRRKSCRNANARYEAANSCRVKGLDFSTGSSFMEP